MMYGDELRFLAGRSAAADERSTPSWWIGLRPMSQEYRQILVDHPTQLPPPSLEDLLPLMGWLIYEASLRPLWTIPPGFSAGGDSDEAVALVRRLIDLTREPALAGVRAARARARCE